MQKASKDGHGHFGAVEQKIVYFWSQVSLEKDRFGAPVTTGFILNASHQTVSICRHSNSVTFTMQLWHWLRHSAMSLSVSNCPVSESYELQGNPLGLFGNKAFELLCQVKKWLSNPLPTTELLAERLTLRVSIRRHAQPTAKPNQTIQSCVQNIGRWDWVTWRQFKIRVWTEATGATTVHEKL